MNTSGAASDVAFASDAVRPLYSPAFDPVHLLRITNMRTWVFALALSASLSVIDRCQGDGSSAPRVNDGTRTSNQGSNVQPPDLVLQTGHSGPVRAVAFSRDGAWVATGGEDARVFLWGAKTGKQIRTFSTSGYSVRALTFCRDGSQLLAATGTTAISWDTATGKPVAVFRGHTKWITSVAWSPNRKTVLTRADDGVAILWDAATGKQRFRLGSDKVGFVYNAAFSADGRRVLTGHGFQAKGRAIFWDVETGKSEPPLEGHNRSVLCSAFAADGQAFATGDAGGVAILWDSARRQVGTYKVPDAQVTSLAFFGSPRRLLIESSEGLAVLWDAESRRELGQFRESKFQTGACLALPKVDRVVTYDGSEGIVWDSTGNQKGVLRGHRLRIACLAANADETTVVTGSFDGTAAAWSTRDGSGETVFSGRSSGVLAVSFDDQGPITLANEKSSLLRGGPDLTVAHWLGGGTQSRRLVGHTTDVNHAVFSSDGKRLVSASADGVVIVWDMVTGKVLCKFANHESPINSIALSQDGKIVFNGSGREATVWDCSTGAQLRHLTVPGSITEVAISVDGKYLLTESDLGGEKRQPPVLLLWDNKTGKRLTPLPPGVAENQEAEPVPVVFPAAPSAQKEPPKWTAAMDRFLPGSIPEPPARAGAVLIDTRTGQRVRFATTRSGIAPPIALSPDGDQAVNVDDSRIVVWDVTQRVPSILRERAQLVRSLAFSRNGKLVIAGFDDGVSQIWDAHSGREICSLYTLDRDKVWYVRSEDGRFDTGDVDILAGLNWVFPDEPFRPVPPEILVRDYYEPRLLHRLMAGEQLRSVRPLGTLNRVQPGVRILRAEVAGAAAEANITVELSRGMDIHRPAKEVEKVTDVYDVRLFRDGQLVGQWPEPTGQGLDPDPTSKEQMQAWRRANHVDLNVAGKATKSFRVRLPHREGPAPVEFSAYAFNEDRVKSETARFVYQAPAHSSSQRPQAYLLCMGVSACQSPRWDLRFAHKDAELIASALGGALRTAGHYDVVPVVLTSAYDPQGKLASASATKDNLKTALQLLAGQKVDAKILEQLPHSEQLRPATPDDLVLVSFSGHGYTDPRGVLYLVPYDVGSAQTDIQAVLPRCLSTLELAGWLREVDAGELTMIVDCCHGGALPGAGFKPGPLGSRGLGQLAYDKGMRVLAASQAADVAVETGGKIQQGLLTYALVRDGLEQRRAAVAEKLTLASLLAYAVQRVPDLYAEVLRGEIKDARGLKAKDVGAVRPTDSAQSWAQHPELFDYGKKRPDVRLAFPP